MSIVDGRGEDEDDDEDEDEDDNDNGKDEGEDDDDDDKWRFVTRGQPLKNAPPSSSSSPLCRQFLLFATDFWPSYVIATLSRNFISTFLPFSHPPLVSRFAFFHF